MNGLCPPAQLLSHGEEILCGGGAIAATEEKLLSDLDLIGYSDPAVFGIDAGDIAHDIIAGIAIWRWEADVKR